MKNLGWGVGGDTQYVLYLIASQAELGSDGSDGLSGAEQVDDVIDLCASVGEPRPAEGVLRVYGHLGDAVLREPDQLRIPVVREIDLAQVLIHYLGEHPLAVSDHDQFARQVTLGSVAGMLGVVVENLSAVGIKPPAGERVR